MLKNIYKKIEAGDQLRENLAELKKEIKKQENKTALLYMLGSDYSLFYRLLQGEDAKARKNTAAIMGELGVQEFLKPLYETYQKESQLFVKGTYLTAMSRLDCRSLMEEFRERLNILTGELPAPESKKHIDEEIRVLTEILLMFHKPQPHKFTGYEVKSDLILLTNRNHKYITLNQLADKKKKEVNAGVYVQTNDIRQVMDIRTYSEMLFMLTENKPLEAKPETAATKLLESGLIEFMEKRHEGTRPFYFRIEIKSKMELDKKSAFAKKLAAELERGSKRTLINTTTNYEFEIRLIENKEGQYNVLLKLFTLIDERFSYRKNAIGVSIHPVNAALTVQLAKHYLKEDGQVLDPFCGVGTMLLERNKAVNATPMYGLDIYEATIKMARENCALDETVVNFINRDFFDFKHEYKFDEIITNMPGKSARKTEDELKVLFEKFFKQAKQVLTEDGLIVMYANEKKCVTGCLKKFKEFQQIKEYEINKKEGTYVWIIRYIPKL